MLPRAAPLLWSVLLLLLVSCTVEHESPSGKLRPLNLVVVTIDTLRADRLSCYGYPKIETPNLDALAREGALFEHAVAQTPLTPPSHASMFTGQYPNAHGVRNTGGFILQSSSVTLAEILQEQGWNTAAFVGASVLKKLFGFNQGFNVYDDQMPKPENTLLAREHPERRAAVVVDHALDWLKTQSRQPFFLWVHVFDPHVPYDPPEPFRTEYAGRPYDGEVAYTDRELGRLFAGVAAKSPTGNTLVVVLSDHGESLGEHGEYTHGVFLYDSTLRIAFLMAGPGVPSGLRVKQQARTIDLLPTILDLMGAKPPSGCQGTSLVPAFSGKEPPSAHSYAETLYSKMNMGWAELRAIRTNRWKYIRAPRRELYDLVADPGETTNIIDRNPADAIELDQELTRVAALGGASEKVRTTMADRKTFEQLRSLGYLQAQTSGEVELTGKGADPKDRVSTLQIIETAITPDSRIPVSQRIAMLRKALDEDLTNPALYHHLGAEYERAGRHPEAMKLYESALQRGIPGARLQSRIGDLLLRSGSKDEAISAYEKAAQMGPPEIESQNNLATAYLEKGRVADAERVYRWIVATDQQNAAAFNGLGLIAIQKQDGASARINFERAVAIDPGLVEAQLNLGLIYKMMGDRSRARACFEAFVAKAPRQQYGHLIPKVQEEIAQLQ